jgi:hypothetical protein
VTWTWKMIKMEFRAEKRNVEERNSGKDGEKEEQL